MKRKKKSEILKSGRKLTEEEKRELCIESVRRVRPHLDALDRWQAQNL